MKKVFIIAAFAGLVSCGHDDCCEKSIVIEGKQYDFTQDDSLGGEWEENPYFIGPKFVPDSVYLNNQAYIDSISQLESVNELLDYLETVPGYQYPEGPLTDRQ